MTTIVATGSALVVLPPGERTIDPTSHLRVRKSRKYMGVQDDLAVVAAGRALAAAASPALGERAGLYLAVGYIPFTSEDIAPVLEASLDADGEFSMARFSGGGFQRAHPLLTFRCLPNMPAYHVSVSFDVQGPYLVTYPGVGQAYLALEEAVAALRDGRVDVALVGGVAHQRNFLVEHHFARLVPPVDAARLRDAAAVVVLEREESARARGVVPRHALEEMSVSYGAFDPVEDVPRASERAIELGPAEAFAALADAGGERGVVRHEARSRDGFVVASTWRTLA